MGNGIYSTGTGIGVRNVRFSNWDLDQSPGGGVLWECLGGDVPLGLWNSEPIQSYFQLDFATLY